jgi:hypothetical protein
MMSMLVFARIIHERCCCFVPLQQRSNGRPDSPLRQSLTAGVLARLAWRLRDFATKRHE